MKREFAANAVMKFVLDRLTVLGSARRERHVGHTITPAIVVPRATAGSAQKRIFPTFYVKNVKRCNAMIAV